MGAQLHRICIVTNGLLTPEVLYADASGRAKLAAGDETGGDTAEVADDVDINAAQDEFVSDAYNLEISDEDLIKEMEALRASPGAEGQFLFL